MLDPGGVPDDPCRTTGAAGELIFTPNSELSCDLLIVDNEA